MKRKLAGTWKKFIEYWPVQWSGIIGWDPSVCKCNRLHVDILWFSIIKLGYILYIPLKWLVIFLKPRTSTGYFSNSTGLSVTNCWFSPIIGRVQIYGNKFATGQILRKTIRSCEGAIFSSLSSKISQTLLSRLGHYNSNIRNIIHDIKELSSVNMDVW